MIEFAIKFAIEIEFAFEITSTPAIKTNLKLKN